MCFSAEASLGAAVALLPAGGYCVEAAWRKDRAYLPLAAVPVLIGLQQLCESQVWVGLDLGKPELVRRASLWFLFFALAVWPVWVPLAVAAVEGRGWKRWAFVAVSGVGTLFAITHYVPLAASGGSGLNPTAVRHSIRYDLSAVPAAGSARWWVWPALYSVAVAGPLLAARDRHLRPLGIAILLAAAASSVLFEYAFASVWCFFAAILCLYLVYVVYQLPGSPPGVSKVGQPSEAL